MLLKVKRLSNFFYIISLLMAIICVACEFKLRPNDGNNVPGQVVVQRYDRLESRYLTTGDFSALQQMNIDYPHETRMLIEDMLQLGEVNNPEINSKFLNFYQDTLLQAIISEVEMQYADMSDINKSLEKSFNWLERSIAGITRPLVYSQIGALGQSIVICDGKIGISLDKYLGEDYPLYAQFYEDGQRRSMNRKNIVPDCIVFYLLSIYPLDNFDSRTQQEKDTHMGRIMWVANKALGTPFFKSDYVRLADNFMKRYPQTSISEFL